MQQIRPLFVVNPEAGNGRGRKTAKRLGRAEIVFTTRPGEAEELAYRGALDGFAPVIAVGGDGTLHEVANGLMRCAAPPPMGVVPVGTGNDFARGLGLPSDPERAIQLAQSEVSGAIDVGRCNGRVFINVGGVGLDTKVALAVNGRTGALSRGRLAYIAQALAELRRYTNPEFTLEVDGRIMSTRSLLVAVANGRYFAGGMRVCPAADVTDGLLDVCVAGDLTRGEAFRLMPAIYTGRHVRHPKVSMLRVRVLRIESPEPLEVQLDGEIVTALPAEFRVAPGALRIAGLRLPAVETCVTTEE